MAGVGGLAECGGGSGVDERLMRKEDEGPKVGHVFTLSKLPKSKGFI